MKRRNASKMFIPLGILRSAYAARVAVANDGHSEQQCAAESIFRLLPENPESARRVLKFAGECLDAYEREISEMLSWRAARKR